MQYLSAREAGRILYTPEYLRQLANADKIDYIRTKGGQRRYNVQAFIEGKSESTFTTVCYCRVSSVKQRDDLERQVAYMRSIYPKTELSETSRVPVSSKDDLERQVAYMRSKRLPQNRNYPSLIGSLHSTINCQSCACCP